MNIRQQLLVEHSKNNALFIAQYIGNNPIRFAALVRLILENEKTVAQRAAYSFMMCTDTYPALLLPHLGVLLQHLETKETHIAVKRNVVRALQNLDIPEVHLGVVAELCFTYLDDPKEAIAVRAFSMTVLYNICVKEPELAPELQATIETHLPHGSAGFKSRAKHILQKLKKGT